MDEWLLMNQIFLNYSLICLKMYEISLWIFEELLSNKMVAAVDEV